MMGLPMRKAKVGHTPGPWNHAFSHREHQAEIATADNKIRIGRIDCRTFEECAANARLIAAAPELLNALEDVLEQFKPGECNCDGEYTQDGIVGHACYFHRIQGEVKRAIAKATGGAK